MITVCVSAKPIGYKVLGSNADVNKFELHTANTPKVHIKPGVPVDNRESSCIYTLTSDYTLVAGTVDIENPLMSFKLMLAYNTDTANYLVSTQVIDSTVELKNVEIISELNFSVIDSDACMIRRVNSIGLCEAVAARWRPTTMVVDTSGEDLGDVCDSFIKSSN